MSLGWPRVNGVVTASCERDVVMRTRRSHAKRIITCEAGCGCVNWLVMFEWGHVWMGCGRVNEVVTCERVRSNSGGYVWTGWSCMNGVWSYERGRHVNLIRCDIFYFELLIRHIERTIGKHICMQTSRLAFKILETWTAQILILLQAHLNGIVGLVYFIIISKVNFTDLVFVSAILRRLVFHLQTQCPLQTKSVDRFHPLHARQNMLACNSPCLNILLTSFLNKICGLSSHTNEVVRIK